jgi:hypothetical protein
MNIKTLAFEINPVNSGSCVTSFDLPPASYAKAGSQEGNFTRMIEERLRARAGNPGTFFFGNTIQPKKNSSEKAVLGSGISEDEIQKIIREFNK